MYTGNKLSDDMDKKMREAFEEGPTEEEIKLDKKYTDIQFITNIVCAILGFDEKLYDENIIFKFKNGVVWVYTDVKGLVSDQYLFNITLRMEDIDKPLELFVSHIHQIGVTNIAVISFKNDGKCEIYTIDDSDEERFEEAEKWLKLVCNLYKNAKSKFFDNEKVDFY